MFDRELIINGKPVCSPEQQVWQNMKDIEELKKIIKYLYFTSETLNSSSVSIALTDTNIPSDKEEGYLIDSNGLLFKIDGNDGTTVLLTYYSDFRGPAGEDGVTPSITANATVDANVGTPSVTVTKSGTDENPVFTFAFQNIKGETGTSLISVEVVAVLPASGNTGTLYFVPNSGSAPNQYDEYIWLNNAWEKLGTQTIDLTNYIQKSNTTGLVKNDGTIDTTNYAPLSKFDYSQTEINTGSKWIDGKDIYKKTIVVGSKTWSTNYEKIADLPTGIDKLIKQEVILQNYNGDAWYTDSALVIAQRSDGIYAGYKESWLTGASWITIYYTKS